MKCLNCGREAVSFLCPNCQSADVLDKVFNEIRYYKPERCENPYLAEFAEGMEKIAVKNAIPTILELFPFEIAEYYYCQYFRMVPDPRFEEAAISYLNVHPLAELKSQRTLYELLKSYIPDDFVKPQKWCQIIAETDGLCCDLYEVAADFYGKIAEYDLSDTLVEKARAHCADPGKRILLWGTPEGMKLKLDKIQKQTQGYRTKKAYWPETEARRRALAKIYDEKGIFYDRITSKPKKVSEDEFTPINECLEDGLDDYCAFWCAGSFSVAAAKSIYQIAVTKVRSGEVVDTFSAFVRPWDGGAAARKSAAKEAGVTVEIIESAEDVDLVIPKFFAFAGEDVLVSTGALGNQAKLISRAARYTGMKEIKNKFLDLLDLAADTSCDFDLANNTREYLLTYFRIPEGKDALDKAQVNHRLYEKLKKFGE